MVPNFIIIGAMKSGTSSLYQYLNIHPDVFLVDYEVNFFDTTQHYARGIVWYENLFSNAKSITAIGERSTNYTKYPYFSGVPQRMAALLPEVKLLYVLRDPIKRIVSHYIHNVADSIEQRTFQDAVLSVNDNAYLAYSQYYRQLAQYLDYYALKRIHILTLEELNNDPSLVMHNLFNFLEIDSSFSSDIFRKQFHQSSEKRIETPAGRLVNRFVLGSPLTTIAHPFIPSGLRLQIIRFYQRHISAKQIKPPTIDTQTYQILQELISPDVEALRKLTHRPFSEWQL